MSEQDSYEGWTLVEQLGHKRLAGYVRSVEIAGAGMLRVDVPALIAALRELRVAARAVLAVVEDATLPICPICDHWLVPAASFGGKHAADCPLGALAALGRTP